MKRYWLVLFAILSAGCATSFRGDAHVPGGPQGCRSQCQSEQMEMDSFVYLGEYSSGCVCVPPGRRESASGAAGAPAGVGVIMQMRHAQAAQQVQ